MEKYSKVIRGIVTAKTSISHGRIPAEEEKKSNLLEFHTSPLLYEEDGAIHEIDLPTISGNAMRGLGRRLLFHHSFEDVLGINFDEILSGYTEKERRYVVNLFENGGSNPKGSHPSGSVRGGVYDEVLADIPMLDLLGGSYVAHHFDGAAIIGHLIPRTKETQELLGSDAIVTDEPLMSVKDLHVEVNRNTKMRSNRDYSMYTLDSVETEEEKAEIKNSAIYGAEFLPAGTKFFWRCALCDTPNKGTLLAFNAIIALIVKHGHVGGMMKKEHGRVEYSLEDFDADASIAEFDDYLRKHRDDVIRGIKLLAGNFKYSLKSDRDKKEAAEKAKKSAKKGKGDKDAGKD